MAAAPAPPPLASAASPVHNALRDDERRRTQAFLRVSGALALCGATAAVALGGTAWTRVAFVAGVAAMLLTYAVLGRRLRDAAGYSPRRALVIVTAANLSGVLAVLHYGVFSPAGMCLMLPIAYFGLTESLAAAVVSAGVTALALAVPSALIGLELVADPGLVTGTGLTPWQRLAYLALVQVVLAAGFALARISRVATTTAIEGLVTALQQVDVARARAEEANAALSRALASGAAGPLTGTALGPWQLGVVLGRGASSDVYEALHREDDRVGALKVPRLDQLRDPVSAALFARETRTLATIESPHVVAVYDVATGPRPYLVMERLAGRDLAALLRRQDRLPPAAVAAWVRQIAAGLERVHAAGVLHRDIKPSNIFRAQGDGRPEPRWVLLDFGVSSVMGDRSAMTQGILLGTPAYMSPEQVRGEALDPRTDIFSLAAVAYRALTGRPTFSGPNHHATLMAVAQDAPLPPSVIVDVPTATDDVFAVALAKRREDRYASATTFAADLESALTGALRLELQQAAQALRMGR